MRCNASGGNEVGLRKAPCSERRRSTRESVTPEMEQGVTWKHEAPSAHARESSTGSDLTQDRQIRSPRRWWREGGKQMFRNFSLPCGKWPNNLNLR